MTTASFSINTVLRRIYSLACLITYCLIINLYTYFIAFLNSVVIVITTIRAGQPRSSGLQKGQEVFLLSKKCRPILVTHPPSSRLFNPYPTAFPYGNGMLLHFYQQQQSSTTKTVHKVINKGLKAYV